MNLRNDALEIAQQAIAHVLPDEGVRRALAGQNYPGKVVVVALGKAAWRMAATAQNLLGSRISHGVVVTKYHHSEGEIPSFVVVESGHPYPDENSVEGARRAVEAVSGLTAQDTVLLMISGGGSALFELPVAGVTLEDMADITRQLLACGADITEINTIRKHLSAVKGGRFAACCAPAQVRAIVLSDVVGDRLDTIASGPAAPDASTCQQAAAIVKKYGLQLSDGAGKALMTETPKELSGVDTVITGNVKELCAAAAAAARCRGYQPLVLTDRLGCEAREAGRFLAAIAQSVKDAGQPIAPPCAIIAGGETVVHLTGTGLGGRNQELALAAAEGIADLGDVVILSVGSDGTDGPTDAAGGLVDQGTLAALKAAGLDYHKILADNDSYHALEAVDGLVITGPTGTNVNDLMLVLCG